MKDDITIDLKDLFYRILLKWRLMIIFAVIFAILADLFGIYKAQKAAADATTDPNVLTDQVGSLKAELSQKEAAEADAAVEMYLSYKDKFDSLTEYFDKSVYASLDHKAVPTLRVYYEVDSHYLAEYPVISSKNYDYDLAEIYIETLRSGYEDVASKYGRETGFIEELISFEHPLDTGLFVVNIVGQDRQMCEDIAAAVDAKVNELTPAVSADLVPHDVTRVSSRFKTASNMGVRTTQAAYINDMNYYRTNMMTVPNNLSAAQKSYYEASIKLSEAGEAAAADEQGTAPAAKISYVQKKYILIGFLFGIMLVCGIVCAFYILIPVVRVRENISDVFQKPVLGSVWEVSKDEKAIGAVDKWLTSLFYGRECRFEYDKRLDMLSAGIAIAMSKEGFETLYVTGACGKGNKVIKDLVKRLSKEVKVSSGECIVYSPGSLEEMSKKQAVVFVETAGDSRYEEISKEIELAEQSRVKIMGFILIQK